MNSSGQYLTNAAAQGLSRFLSVAANLISLVMVARILGVESFGQYAFIMAYVNIASSLADLGTTSVLARDLARQKNKRPGLYFGNYLFLRGGITSAATLLALISAPFVKPDLFWPLFLCSLAIPVIASRFFDPVFQVFERPQYSVYTSFCYGLSLLTVSTAVLVWLELPLLYFLAGWIACNLVYTILAFLLAGRLIKPQFEFNRVVIRQITLLAAPLGVGALFSVIHTRADVFLLGYLRSIQEVGFYSAAYKLLDVGSIMALTLLWPLIPILSRQLQIQPPTGLQIARTAMELGALICFPAAILAPYIANPLILLIYGPEYMQSAAIIGIFGLVFAVLVFSLIGVVINLSAGRVNHAYWNTALAVAVNVSLNMLWIPEYGITGAAYATLASHLCMLLVQQGYVLKNVGNLFRTGFWTRLTLVSLTIFVLLRFSAAEHHLYVVPLAAVLYVLMAFKFGLLPRLDISGLLRRKNG